MKQATSRRLRSRLEILRARAIRQNRVEHDPIRYVLRYRRKADQEIVGILSALLAYGRVDLLCEHIRELISHLGERPAERLRESVPRLPPMVYRFHRSRDLSALLRGIRAVLLRHDSLGKAFAKRWRESGDLQTSLTGFAHELRDSAGRGGPGLRYLIPDPELGGACKRWNLYLRWMVRREDGDPDPGAWNRLVPPSALLVPLDTHLVRVGRRLGFTSRKTVNWKMAEEVTAALRRADPEDPVRYDFPLCHLGMAGVCTPKLADAQCARCPLRPVCPTGGA